jgi:hypothetical protein
MTVEVASYQGKILAVETFPAGAKIALAASIGATEVQVDDSTDFPDVGGQLSLAGVVYTYSFVDPETDIISLSSALTVAVVEGDDVYLFPEATEKRALVQIGDFEDAVFALVPHNLMDKIDVGLREDDGQEAVNVVQERGGWVLDDLVSTEPVIMGQYIEENWIPEGVPGLIEDSANGKNKVIFSLNPPVAEDNIAGDTWWQYDADNNVIGQWKGDGGTTWTPVQLSHQVMSSLDLGKATVGLLNGARIEAGTITADLLSSVLILVSRITSGGAGRRWEADQDGIRLYETDGTILINFPTDPNTPSSFYGDLVASSLTIEDQLAIRGLVNEISRGSQLVLAGGTTSPTSPPAVTVDWEQIDTAVADGNPDYAAFNPPRVGWVRWTGAGVSRWWTCQAVWGQSAAIQPYSDAGDYLPFTSPIINTSNLANGKGGLAVVGANIYVLGQRAISFTTIQWRVQGFDATGAKIADWVYTHPAGTREPRLTSDGTNLIIAYSTTADNKFAFRKWNPLTGAAVGSVVASAAGFSAEIGAIYYGNGDFGSARMVVSVLGSSTAVVLDSVGAAVPTEYFPLTSTQVQGIFYYSSVYWSHDPAGHTLTKHTSTTWTTESSNWYVSNTWYDGDNNPLSTVNVSNKALTSNVATLTTSTAHGLVAGNSVVVAGVGSPFDGTYTVASAPTGTTLTYARTNANVASAAATGTLGLASGTHETAQSPRKPFTMKKRARLNLTTGIIPLRPIPNTADDAKAARLYLGRGASDPGRAFMERIVTLGDAVRNYTTTAVTLPAGAATSPPPSTSNFPATSPGKLVSSDGTTLVLQGNGDATFGEHTVVGATGKTYGALVAGRHYASLGGALRNSGAGWGLINDSAHRPFGIASVTTMSDRIRVTYSATALKVGSFIIGCDERMAELGLRAGASVGTTYADIFIYRDSTTSISDYVSYNGTTWVSFNGVFTMSYNGAGVLTLTHEDMGTTGHQAIQATARGTAAALAGSFGATTSQVVFYASGWPGASPVATGAASSAQHRVYVTRQGNRQFNQPVDPSTIVEALGNFWFLGLIEDA